MVDWVGRRKVREPRRLSNRCSRRCLAASSGAPTSGRHQGTGKMLIRVRRGWELPESAATDEAVFRDRRRLLKGIAAGPILAAGVPSLPAWAAEADPSAGLYPARRNDRYALDRAITA